jgi:predicted dienelactone hydrolase
MRLWLRSLALGTISALSVVIPAGAAEKIYFTYAPLRFSLRVTSLETFARTGEVNQELAFYLKLIGSDGSDTVREALTQNADVKPVLLWSVFNTSIGETILERLGKIIEIPGGINGKYAIRGTLVQAALDPQGLSVLSFLRKFPTDIEIDLKQALRVAKGLEETLAVTKDMVAQMSKLSAQQAASEPQVNFATLPDIRQPGTLGVNKQTWNLADRQRQRQFRVDVYQPQRWRAGKTPVVIFSHGLASRPEDFSDRAEHLASYGYVVALPQHPGSDYTQAQDLIAGYEGEVFKLDEFIDRPRDISYVIDELERRNNSEFGGRLDLEAVGVAGHSFGGYTALAVGGAEIDFDNLNRECNRQVWRGNISLLLQCQALRLPRQTYSFRDRRVQAVLAANPVNSVIFGEQGLSKIEIPTILGAGSHDPATPAVYEQGRSFLWLKTPNKYLALAEGEAHVNFSNLDPGIKEALDSISYLTLPSQDLIDRYANALFLAFFEVHIAKNEAYRPYLQSAYAQFISEPSFRLYLVNAKAAEGFSESSSN